MTSDAPPDDAYEYAENGIIYDPRSGEVLTQEEAMETFSASSSPGLFYSSLTEWVEDWLTSMYIRKNAEQLRWCPAWWAHPEAVVVLMALWEAWELQRVGEPGSMAQYLVTTFYPLMHELTGPNGTFRLCDPTRGHAQLSKLQEPGVLPTLPAPDNITQILGGSA